MLNAGEALSPVAVLLKVIVYSSGSPASRGVAVMAVARLLITGSATPMVTSLLTIGALPFKVTENVLVNLVGVLLTFVLLKAWLLFVFNTLALNSTMIYSSLASLSWLLIFPKSKVTATPSPVPPEILEVGITQVGVTVGLEPFMLQFGINVVTPLSETVEYLVVPSLTNSIPAGILSVILRPLFVDSGILTTRAYLTISPIVTFSCPLTTLVSGSEVEINDLTGTIGLIFISILFWLL